MINEHQLYIVSEGLNGPVKIGRSKNARARVDGLQTGNARRLRLVAVFLMSRDSAINAEKMLHEELVELHLVGEWFNIKERSI